MAGLLCSCATRSLRAADEDPNRCCDATVRGDYGLYATGILAVPPPLGIGQTETHATIALRTYDGKGNFKDVGVLSNGQISGVIQGRRRPFLFLHPEKAGRNRAQLLFGVGQNVGRR